MRCVTINCKRDIAGLVNATYPIIQRLDEIALRPHPFSAPEYIDLIIKLKQMSDIQSKVINSQSVFNASCV
jgi:hypothetical protein